MSSFQIELTNTSTGILIRRKITRSSDCSKYRSKSSFYYALSGIFASTFLRLVSSYRSLKESMNASISVNNRSSLRPATLLKK